MEYSRGGLRKAIPICGALISVQAAAGLSSNPPSLLEPGDFTVGEGRPGLIMNGHSGDDRLKAFASVARDPNARLIETVAVSGIALQHIPGPEGTHISGGCGCEKSCVGIDHGRRRGHLRPGGASTGASHDEQEGESR